MPLILLASCLAASLSAAAQAPTPPPRSSAPARVLIVTGQDIPAHDWKSTAPALESVLEADGRCLVTLTEDPAVLGADRIFAYDAVVLHFRNEKPLPDEEKIRANLQRLLAEGRGLVLIHFACGAFADWPGFGAIAGMVWDGKNTHDPRGPFEVRITGRDHPITRGLSAFPTDDELYIGLAERRAVEILATARSKVTGRDHPMAFTFTAGPGRVFHTALGHDAKALTMPGAAELIRRGTLWAAGKDPAASGARQPSSGPLTVLRPTPHEWIVRSGAQTLCAYSFAPEQLKPYVRKLAPPGGVNLLRDAPFDHKHHHGLMYAIRVNGINFWEEVAGGGVEKPVGAATTELGAGRGGRPRARLQHRIHWVAPQDASLADTAPAALLIEDRTLSLTLDESAREVALHWHAEFQVGPRTGEVVLTGSNYNGLGLRFLQTLDPLAVHWIGGAQPDLGGSKQDVRPAPWGAVTFDAPGGRATVAVFASPRNAGASRFFSMARPFAYLAATQGLDQSPLRYRPGDRFTLDYLITASPEIKAPAALADRAGRWASWITRAAK